MSLTSGSGRTKKFEFFHWLTKNECAAQNAPRNPLVKYYTSWQSCLKRRRHLRPLSTLFLTLNHLTSAKWKHMSAFRSVYYLKNTLYSSLPSLRISFWAWADMQPKLRMRYRMSVIYGHPVMAATRTPRFSDHVTKRNGGSGDENGSRCANFRSLRPRPCTGGILDFRGRGWFLGLEFWRHRRVT